MVGEVPHAAPAFTPENGARDGGDAISRIPYVDMMGADVIRGHVRIGKDLPIRVALSGTENVRNLRTLIQGSYVVQRSERNGAGGVRVADRTP